MPSGTIPPNPAELLMSERVTELFEKAKMEYDYIVVDTDDVLLICRKEKEQEIKEYVAEVKRNKGERYL